MALASEDIAGEVRTPLQSEARLFVECGRRIRIAGLVMDGCAGRGEVAELSQRESCRVQNVSLEAGWNSEIFSIFVLHFTDLSRSLALSTMADAASYALLQNAVETA